MLTINGKEVEFREGATVLEVARDNGIYIPSLCAHKELFPFGACRLCLVKIEHMRGFPPACTTPAAEGMKVITEDTELHNLRKNVLELILSEHPNSCLMCDQKELCAKYYICPPKSGRATGCTFCPARDRCELRKVTEYLGLKEIRIPFKYKDLPMEREDPFFDRDYNLCILCGRCVRVCQEVRGIGAIAFTKRGHDTKIGTAFGKSYLDGGCRFCGACVDVCPTGALSARGSKWHGLPEREVTTTCALCSVGCRLKLEAKWEKVMAARPDEEGPANHGQACVKGRFCIPALVNDAERLKYPLIRKEGRLVPAGWEEAAELVAKRLGRYSPKEVGFVASPFLTNEAAYLLQKFARIGTGTNNIDIASAFSGPVIDAHVRCLGVGAGTGTIEDIESAEWIIILGADILTSHPVLTVSINKARRQGATVCLIGPENDIILRMVDNLFPVQPAAYLPLLSGILKVLVDKDAFDKDFVSSRCNGFESLKRSLLSIDLEEIIEPCGLSVDRVEELVSQILKSKRGCILYGSKILESSNPQQVISLLFNILLLRGSHLGLIPLRIAGNEQGAGDMGALPNFLPGYRDFSDKDAVSELEGAWSAKLPTEPGVSYSEMIRAASKGTLKALYITSGWIPDKTHLSQVDFIVLHGIYPSPLFEIADVVFPSVAFTEENGTITSLERRVQCIAAAVRPVGMALPDWKIICLIAEKMKLAGFAFTSAEEVFDEICRVNSLISGHGIWSLIPSAKFALTPLEELTWKESDIISKEISLYPLYYRGIDITEKVHDLKLVYERVLGG
ncbi:MAG: hypothetical protein AVO38_02990 [delta proteobacterium ML8_D]|nr:MAG: hypothetical protein AVO38_02990 [delta proteobacterium ML8_D]